MSLLDNLLNNALYLPRPMRIGIDIMGGDFAPEAVLFGALSAKKELPFDVELLLIGDTVKASEILTQHNISPQEFEFYFASESIGMEDHPLKAFTAKKDSSIVRGFELLKSGKIDAFASAGNTGAMMVGVMTMIHPAKGIIRPCLAIQIPRITGNPGIVLDVGLNPDAKPEVLYQYGLLGSIYAKNLFNIKNPKIGLLNIGGEDAKGNLAAKAAFQLMKKSTQFNFIGNVEGNEIFNTEKSDVIVCDGFTGNIVLKEAEAFYNLLKQREITDDFFERFNFENSGGTPILGINSNVIIAHGHSTPTAIKNMILKTRDFVNANLPEKIIETLNHE